MKRLALLLVLLAGAASAQFVPSFLGRSPNAVAATQESGRYRYDCFGNSITLGTGYSEGAYTPYTTLLASTTGWTVLNFGIGGNTAAQAYARWVLNSKGAASVKTLVIEIGVNDINLFSATGEATWGTVQTWIEEAQGVGQQVAVFTIMPFAGHSGWSESKETQRLDFNSRLRTYVSAHPDVRLIDMESFIGDGEEPPSLRNEDDYGDGLHPSQAGLQLMATRARVVLQQ